MLRSPAIRPLRVGLAVSVALVSIAGTASAASASASPPASTVEASKKKPKLVLHQRFYRGTTSQGQRISFRTYNSRKVVRDLSFLTTRTCKRSEDYPSGPPFYENVAYDQTGEAPLRGRGFWVFATPDPAKTLFTASVPGRAGPTAATGQVLIRATGNGTRICEAMSLTFSIPKVKELRGRGGRRR